jgi:glyoxylase-like metal-dependent hydrolase (beta-lactamase superfamily II)/rhodanese-related sulfurtransferase
MILKTYEHPWLGHRSYLVADGASGIAAVIDPHRDVDPYLEDAWKLDLEIRHVFLTKLHCDFEAGHRALRDRAGSMIYLGAWARPDYFFTPVKDGDVLEFGDLRLRILETPGHTMEGICVEVYDLRASSETPQLLLTGDTLLEGDVGRPDVFASPGTSAAELAELLYDSLARKVLSLPDATRLLSSHAAPAVCAEPHAGDPDLGLQKRCNFALRLKKRRQFVQVLTADRPEAARYLTSWPAANRFEHPWWSSGPVVDLRPCEAAEAVRARNRGIPVLDVRDPADFAAAHFEGSLNIPLGPRFATWARALLEPGRPALIVAEPGREEEARVVLGEAGFDSVAGYLRGGMEALEDRPDLVRQVERVTAPALARQLASPAPPVIVDVRSEDERKGPALEGAEFIPLEALPGRLAALPSGRRLVAVCPTGTAASVAASLVARKREGPVSVLVGGMAAWELLT